jgi:uncharacterized protein (DUF433 family)
MAIANITTSRYVIRDPEILAGEPTIVGTKVAVRDIASLWKEGIRPEDIPNNLPFVTIAQVFDAISFYLDNQPEIDEYIEYFKSHPSLSIPSGLRANPLWDEVIEQMAADRHEIDAQADQQSLL